MAGRAVIHIDIDAFFATVELKKNPSCRGQAIIVGGDGDSAGRSVVSAASYEARSRGVTPGMTLKKAAKLCPDGVFLPVDFASYEAESDRFMDLVREYGPLVESFGLDEVFLEPELPEQADPIASGMEIAREIKSRIKRELKFTASAGVGPNKLLAKMACDLGKPDGLFSITARDVDKLFAPMEASRLWGVGPRVDARLKELVINTIGEIARTPVSHLVRNFGAETGRTLHEHARGIDDSPVVPFREPGALSREVTFESDLKDAQLVKETLFALTEDVVARMKEASKTAGVVSIKLRFNDFETVTRSGTLEEPAGTLNCVRAEAGRLLDSIDLPKAVRLVGVKLSGLSDRTR